MSPPSGRPGLSIVMPALDEEDGIGRAVAAALGALDALAPRIGTGEVVVVDDGSTDATASRVRTMAGCDPRVRLVSHPRCRGLGAAVRTGLAASCGEVVCYTDADLPFDLDELGRLLVLLEQADVVSAYRRDRRAEGPRRFVYSLGYNALVRVVLGLRVRDVNFAAKLLRRPVVDALDLRSEGSFIDAEILARSRRAGFRIAQCGLDYRPRSRGVSTLSSARTIVTMVREMGALRTEVRVPRPARSGAGP